MIKIKPLLPSLREKKRYLVFEILNKDISASSFRFEDLKAELINSFETLNGTLNLAKGGLMVFKNKWDDKMKKGIIKINHRYVNALKASLTMVTKINSEQVVIRSLGVSGNMKKAQKFIAS